MPRSGHHRSSRRRDHNIHRRHRGGRDYRDRSYDSRGESHRHQYINQQHIHVNDANGDNFGTDSNESEEDEARFRHRSHSDDGEPYLHYHNNNVVNDNNNNQNEQPPSDRNAPNDDERARDSNVSSVPGHPFVEHRINVSTLQTVKGCADDVPEGLRIIRIQTCQSEHYATHANAMEETALVGVMLSIRTANSKNPNTVITSGSARYAPGAGSNARMRTNNTVTVAQYDRIATLADCSSKNGTIFACLMESKKEATKFFSNMVAGHEGVGDVVLLEEVYPVNDTLGTSTNVPLVKRVTRVLPLAASMADIIAPVKIKMPSKGDTRFFSKHGEKDIKFGHIIIEQAICGGKLWYGYTNWLILKESLRELDYLTFLFASYFIYLRQRSTNPRNQIRPSVRLLFQKGATRTKGRGNGCLVSGPRWVQCSWYRQHTRLSFVSHITPLRAQR
jgi:hypothetical protein